MESLEDLLAEVKSEYQEPTKPIEPKLKSAAGAENSIQNQAIANPNLSFLSYKNTSPEASLLAQVQLELKAEEQSRQLQKEQQLKEQQIKEEQIKNQQKQALNQQAETWLKKLDPLSPEGMWFEEFADGYPSKTAAAIDYLQALTINS